MLARVRIDVFYVILQSSKEDLGFFKQIIPDPKFKDLFNPSNPVDQAKKDKLVKEIKELPKFEAVDKTDEGNVDATAKNINMEHQLRRYFLHVLQFFQYEAPIDEGNRNLNTKL